MGSKTRLGYTTNPRYPIAVWSQHANLMSGKPTTTNANESFHANMEKLIPSNSSLWKVIKFLQDTEMKVRVRREEFLQYQRGERPSKDLQQIERDDQIRNLVNNRNSWPRGEFLARLGSLKDLTRE